VKRAYVTPVLDLSLPLGEEEIAGVSSGLRALLSLLEERPFLRVEVALSGAVTMALLRHGEERALQMLAERSGAGQVAFLSTACFGAFLPLLPSGEAWRQLELNESVNREALGDFVYRPEGLFPPQLGYSRSIAELGVKRGLKRIVVDDLAYRGRRRPLPKNRHFVLAGAENLVVFFLDRALSESLASRPLDPAALRREIDGRLAASAVLRIPARALCDGSPPMKTLAALEPRSPVVPSSLSELLALFPEQEVIEPLPCALGTEPAELGSGVPFAKWSSPANELHALLWRLVELAAAEAARLDASSPGPGWRLRARLDASLDCAAWRFASGRPALDLRRVREGGARLLDAVVAARPAVRERTLAEARELFARLTQRCDSAARGDDLRPAPPGF